jgi:mannan polymerase II complex MNN10 subunit
MWWKFAMAERLIKSGKYDWIWWMDFDTLITNTDIKVTDIIEEELRNVTNPDEIDYLFTHDCNGLNAGSFLVRGHERSLKFMQDVVQINDKSKAAGESISEQESMVRYMKGDSAPTNTFHVVPQWKLNAFPPEIKCTDDSRLRWAHGFFVVHFAGAWAHVRGDDPTGQLMNKYEHEIIWGDWKEFY